MAIKELVQQDVITIESGATAQQAAQALEKEGVGSLVVVDDGDPVGLLTDRDVALRVVGQGRDPTSIRVSKIMSSPLKTIDASLGFHEAVDRMADSGVRRLPVTENGALVGILTLDDVMGVVTSQIALVESVLLAQSKPPSRSEAS